MRPTTSHRSGCSPPGYYHLPNGTMATTLGLLPDGGATVWTWECDAIGLFEMAWQATSTSTVELQGRIDDPSSPPRMEGPRWSSLRFSRTRGHHRKSGSPGASCSVCTPGHPMAVVGCPTPDAGVLAWCCSGDAVAETPVSPTCKLGLVAGEPANAIAPGQCTCPSGSVSAAECTGYPKVFCGGL